MAEKVCDYRCWMAKGKTCRCICGGEFHGCARDHEDPVFMALLADPELNKFGFTKEMYDRKKKLMKENGELQTVAS